MPCMRCGREAKEDQAFCAKCSQYMAACPVEPDAMVQLPRRNPAVVQKKTLRRRAPTPEERIAILTRRTRRLAIALVTVIVLVIVLSIPAIRWMASNRYRTGQNYKALPTATETTAATYEAVLVPTGK